ncbi:carboxypeptidase regulatory-like domain-containing protein [Melittangium boletus]|uniref:carboxypeptidase regulatory-like domain-containing protein n=1 Tax=Melittangium boletus TaxID=83453 RepID=UPI003DA6250D
MADVLPTDAVRLHGRVRDARGPVAGARVLASAAVAGESLSALPCHEGSEKPLFECGDDHVLFELVAQRAGEVPVLAQGTSSADGTFTLEVPRADGYTLWVESAEGVAVQHDVRAGGADIDLVLLPGSRVSGVVRGEDEAPIAGALVTAIYTRHSRFFEARSDDAGQFDLGTLPRGDYTLVSSRRGLVPTRSEFKAYAPRLRLEPVLTQPRRVSGIVLHQGRPVVGAAVSLKSHALAHVRHARTDARGHFAFEYLSALRFCSLEARHPGLVGSLEVGLYDPDPPNIPPLTERTGLTVELVPTVSLRGVVRDMRGRPLPNAKVEDSFENETRTDVRGAYVFENLLPARYRFRAVAEGHLESDIHTVDLTQGGRELDFALASTIHLSGVLVDEEGQPVAGEDLRLASSEPEETLWATSGSNGRFTFDVPQAGRYHLQLNDRPQHFIPLMEVTVPADLRLSVKRRPTLRGEVLDDTGQPLSRVEVTLWPEDPGTSRQHFAHTLTDARGRFQLRAPTQGRYQLTAEFILGNITQTVTRWVTVDAKEVDLRLTLEKGRALAGVVLDSRGRPVDGVDVEVVSPLRTDLVRRARTDGQKTGPDGRFFFQSAPDEAELRVLKRGHRPLCSGTQDGWPSMRLEPGAREVRAVLVEVAVISGRLVHADGSPVTQYVINNRSGFNAEGRFGWSFWCTGPITLELSEFEPKPGAKTLRHTVSVQAETSVDIGTLVLDAP